MGISLEKANLIELYRDMLNMRLFEEKSAELYTGGYINGFCHLYIGQEAVVAAITHLLDENDSQITSYRDHAHMLALGVDRRFIFAELLGKRDGVSKGKGGSMHMYAKDKNFYGGNGIVGAQVSIGTGIAFANKYKNENSLCAIYFGDGAINQGQVYESFNMASLWKLPALYVLENNRYAMGTPITRSTSGKDLTTRGDPFGIPTICADGMDLLDMLQKSTEAIEYVRSGAGPIILHADTYRYRGHSMSDPATYRTRDEVDNVKKTRDPIVALRKYLEAEFGVADHEFEKIEDILTAEIAADAQWAIDAEYPDENDLMEDVFSE